MMVRKKKIQENSAIFLISLFIVNLNIFFFHYSCARFHLFGPVTLDLLVLRILNLIDCSNLYMQLITAP